MQTRRVSFAPLNYREFRLFVLVRFFYVMALQMVTTTIGYELFHLTKDSFYIGLAGLSEFIPVFGLALYAGHVIDQSDKRNLMLRGSLGYMFCAIALIVITLQSVQSHISTGLLIGLFCTVIFFTGAIRSFVGPTFNAILAQLIPREMLPNAASISTSVFLAATITGHASAGLLIAHLNVSGTLGVALCYVVIASLALTRLSPKPAVPVTQQQKTWERVREGIRFVFSNKIMLAAISLDLFAVLFGGAKALIPEISSVILKVGPEGFGWLNAAIDIGSVLVIITLTLSPLKRHQGLILMLAVAGFGACIVVFGLSNIYALSFIAMMVAGMMDGISVIIRGTVFQLVTPDEMRGRVSSVNSMFINSSNELGQFESGLTSRMLGGARQAVIFGGCMTLLVAIIAWFRAPKLKKFEY